LFDTSGGQGLAVRTVRHASHEAHMSFEGGLLLARRHVPELDRRAPPHPEASVLPSGLYAREFTGLECPLRVAFSLPVHTSQCFAVWSTLPEASVLPSGLYAIDFTQSVCPLRVAFSWPVATSQSFTVWSWLAEASVSPSGLYTTDATSSE